MKWSNFSHLFALNPRGKLPKLGIIIQEKVSAGVVKATLLGQEKIRQSHQH
jgi:hypothetical protein